LNRPIPSLTWQYPLPLPVRSAKGAEDFVVSESNRAAVAWLDAWPDWPTGALLVYGPPASGKSHLGSIWAAIAGAATLAGAALTVETALTLDRPALIEQADACPDSQSLFHLLNRARAEGLTLMLTARQPAALWATGLPDLESRLKALPAVNLELPDDTLLVGLAQKLFSDRQIPVAADAIRYMLLRLERSCATVADAVARVDAAALAAKRPVTRRLIGLALGLNEPFEG